ncbi:MAG: NAD(P)-dependent alcohol dehydrogenase [Thermoplasmata archaeon]|nr:NAD(P)-dependent alcohol dehydrogenase [Thermoplasmata archaeon]
MSASAAIRPGTFKAWVLDRYGPPEILELRDIPFPAFRDGNEVLVRVFATSVNPADRHMLKPPLILRRRQGMLRPKDGRPGLDLAGRVEVIGKNVTELHVGDEVFGVGRGAFAEYAISDQIEVALKPTGVTFEQAAAVPIAAITALQGLRDKAQVRPGQRVLINGASGGVGTFAVQIAKWLGADVSAVCSAPNVELNRSLGARRVFDYAREDFTKSGEQYDVIFDTQLNHSLSAYRKVLLPSGLLLVVGGGPGSVGRVLPRMLKTMLGTRLVGPRSKFFIASVRTADLRVLKELLETGKVTPVIDRHYSLGQVPQALRYLMDGHARGKIVVTV